MSKLIVEGVEGVKALEGKDLGATDWQKLTYEDIARFADATGDHQWIHLDRERIARESPFKVPIAHGYFTLSRIAGLFFELLETRGFPLVVNYGLNKVRFPMPLKEGARYRLAAKCQSVKDVAGGLEAVFVASIEIENEPKPTCVAEAVFRYLKG